jgi:hypothetical protein
MQKLAEFRQKRKAAEESGRHHLHAVKDINQTMKFNEFQQGVKIFNKDLKDLPRSTACRDPLQGHDITKEYRTKMADWMIEVTTSFKCQPRTYFLALTIFDRYLIAMSQNGHFLANKDVHRVGVISMYIASKFDDLVPLHAKIVSEKIAHGTMTPKQVVEAEREFLIMLDFNCNFVTHYEFLEVFIERVTLRMNESLKKSNESFEKIQTLNALLTPLASMTMLLVKMSLQCLDFCWYSQSTIVMAALYASTAFVKHSKTYRGDKTNEFVAVIRKIIFDLLIDELADQ